MFCCCDFQLESKKDAFSAELQHYCHTQPVVVIRGIATALKLGTLSAWLYISCSHYGRHGCHSRRRFVEVKRIPDSVFLGRCWGHHVCVLLPASNFPVADQSICFA